MDGQTDGPMDGRTHSFLLCFNIWYCASKEKKSKIHYFEGLWIRTDQRTDRLMDWLAIDYVKYNKHMLVLVSYDALIHKIDVFCRNKSNISNFTLSTRPKNHLISILLLKNSNHRSRRPGVLFSFNFFLLFLQNMVIGFFFPRPFFLSFLQVNSSASITD